VSLAHAGRPPLNRPAHFPPGRKRRTGVVEPGGFNAPTLRVSNNDGRAEGQKTTHASGSPAEERARLLSAPRGWGAMCKYFVPAGPFMRHTGLTGLKVGRAEGAEPFARVRLFAFGASAQASVTSASGQPLRPFPAPYPRGTLPAPTPSLPDLPPTSPPPPPTTHPPWAAAAARARRPLRNNSPKR
jgi:hypothetical protein